MESTLFRHFPPPSIDDMKVNLLTQLPPQEEPILFGNFKNLELTHLATLNMETIAHSDDHARSSLSDIKGEWFTFAGTNMKRTTTATGKDIQIYCEKNLETCFVLQPKHCRFWLHLSWKDFSPRLCTWHFLHFLFWYFVCVDNTCYLKGGVVT